MCEREFDHVFVISAPLLCLWLCWKERRFTSSFFFKSFIEKNEVTARVTFSCVHSKLSNFLSSLLCLAVIHFLSALMLSCKFFTFLSGAEKGFLKSQPVERSQHRRSHYATGSTYVWSHLHLNYISKQLSTMKAMCCQ